MNWLYDEVFPKFFDESKIVLYLAKTNKGIMIKNRGNFIVGN